MAARITRPGLSVEWNSYYVTFHVRQSSLT